jgi:pyranose oxidase
MRLQPNRDGTQIEYAVVQNLKDWETIHVKANTYVVCCNSYLTPQLLYASEIRPDALGRYLTEQPMAFSQIVLKQEIVDSIIDHERFGARVREHQKANPLDPVPIPFSDPEPQVWIPVSEDRPWHCQIHRDAFHYGDLAPEIDSRLIVDLRWFGIVQPRYQDRIQFSDERKDVFGMPQPTFDWVLDDGDRRIQHIMMRDMERAGSALGGYLPGSQPQFVAPGLPVHVTGTVRMGTEEKDSVVDHYSRVWGFENLYLGGNGLIPKGNAANPTLTTVAHAVRAAEHIIAERTS